MCLKNQKDESLYQEIKKLDEEIKELFRKKQEIQNRWKKLLMEEDLSKGKVYAKEIHELMQEKLMLEVEIDYKQKKKNRLLFDV
ncbi:hypothetical protein JCM13304A_00620 [Desulfothermus okinawensis JCM 13304]